MFPTFDFLKNDPSLSYFLIIAYFSGSIPFGLIITKYFLGFDVRKHGSGNIGMTNVMRTAGKTPGIITFILDFSKGLVPILLIKFYCPTESIVSLSALAALFAVLGHTKSIFLKFTGGKGVATNLGVWLAFDWRVFLIVGLCWLAVFLITKVSSLSALLSIILLPIGIFYFYRFNLVFYVGLLVSLYILFLHKENVKRLLKGDEKKLNKTR